MDTKIITKITKMSNKDNLICDICFQEFDEDKKYPIHKCIHIKSKKEYIKLCINHLEQFNLRNSSLQLKQFPNEKADILRCKKILEFRINILKLKLNMVKIQKNDYFFEILYQEYEKLVKKQKMSYISIVKLRKNVCYYFNIGEIEFKDMLFSIPTEFKGKKIILSSERKGMPKNKVIIKNNKQYYFISIENCRDN